MKQHEFLDLVPCKYLYVGEDQNAEDYVLDLRIGARAVVIDICLGVRRGRSITHSMFGPTVEFLIAYIVIHLLQFSFCAIPSLLRQPLAPINGISADNLYRIYQSVALFVSAGVCDSAGLLRLYSCASAGFITRSWCDIRH